MEFCNLHVHTPYSFLDGLCTIDKLIERVKELGQSAIAVTEHGNMHSAVEFYNKCKKAGIKPIIGIEIYTVPDRLEHFKIQRESKESGRGIKEIFKDLAKNSKDHFGNSTIEISVDSEGNNIFNYKYGFAHLILLAKNEDGYNNLSLIASEAQINGFYTKPRIDMEFIKNHSKGLVALSACRAGTIPRLILRNEFDLAKQTAKEYNEIFENFYLEIQPSENIEQKFINQKLIEFSKELNIPLVVTTDAHYVNEEDADIHDILLAIQTKSVISNPDRFQFDEKIYYIHSGEELLKKGIPKEAIENTVKIADMCNFDFNFGADWLPSSGTPLNYNEDLYLQKLSYNGLYQKMAEGKIDSDLEKYKERLEFELNIIKTKKLSGYLLIVWDFINWAKKNDVMVGPGRGSGAGSLINWCIGITEVDPIKYGLLFERFISLDRPGYPDVDTDLEEYIDMSEFGVKSGREKVYDYVVQKYGFDHTAKIITFGTLAAKLALRDVGRTLEIDHNEIMAINKFIHNDSGKQWTLKECIEGKKDAPPVPEIVAFSKKYPLLYKAAMELEGIPRHTSVHAAGVLITPKPINEIIPLSLATEEDETKNKEKVIVSQYEMGHVEKLGIQKMDFLGLRTLGVLKKTRDLIKERHNKIIDFYNLPLDDKKTLDLFKQGKTAGVFQFEADQVSNIIQSFKTLEFKDLVAITALNRPGPMEMIPKYIAVANGKKDPEYLFPEMEPILKETNGVIVYQEQCMKIATDLAGFSKADSDGYRSAIGKFLPPIIAIL